MASTRAHSDSMDAWQERYENDQTGRWTHRLIPDLRAWMERQYGEVDYYLIQFLTVERVAKSGNGAMLELPRREGYSRAHIFRICALLGKAPALHDLEARDSGPGNATESRKLG